MKEPRVARGEQPQNPICNLNINLPDSINSEMTGAIDPDHIEHLENKFDAAKGEGVETAGEFIRC